MKYINATPRWEEILPSWQVIVIDATETLKPEQMERFWIEARRMAEAADKFGDLLAFLRNRGWGDNRIVEAITDGRFIQEADRNTVKESEDDL